MTPEQNSTASVALACMTWPYRDHPWERALEGIAAAGFRHVSLGLPHQGTQPINDAAPGEAARVRAVLDGFGLTPVSHVSTDALSPSQPEDAAIRRMDFLQELGVTELLSLGISSYRRFPAEPIAEEELTPRYAEFVERYRRHGAEAERRGMVITLKPHTGNTATAQVVLDTIAAIGSPAVQGCYDPGNVRFYEGIDPAEDFPPLARHSASFVAKDHAGARAEADFPVPGEGDCDFAAMFAELYGAGFSGPVIVERLDGRGEGMTVEEIDARVARSATNLRALLAAAGFSCR